MEAKCFYVCHHLGRNLFPSFLKWISLPQESLYPGDPISVSLHKVFAVAYCPSWSRCNLLVRDCCFCQQCYPAMYYSLFIWAPRSRAGMLPCWRESYSFSCTVVLLTTLSCFSSCLLWVSFPSTCSIWCYHSHFSKFCLVTDYHLHKHSLGLSFLPEMSLTLLLRLSCYSCCL